MPTICFADSETTGIYPEFGHEIWDLALIVRRPALADTEHQFFLRPDLRKADPMALTIGRYYDRTADLRPPGTRDSKALKWADPDKVMPWLARTLSGAILVAHNAPFDAGHLKALLARHGHVLTCDYHYRDLGSLVTGWMAAKGLPLIVPPKLNLIAQACGIDPAGYATHTALGDTRLARDIHDVVIGGAA